MEITNLNILGKITIGQTLSSTTLQILDHTKWGTTFWRKYAGESRNETIRKVIEILDKAFDFLQTLKDKDIDEYLKTRELFGPALIGVKNLSETYKSDIPTSEKFMDIYNTYFDKINEDLKLVLMKDVNQVNDDKKNDDISISQSESDIDKVVEATDRNEVEKSNDNSDGKLDEKDNNSINSTDVNLNSDEMEINERLNIIASMEFLGINDNNKKLHVKSFESLQNTETIINTNDEVVNFFDTKKELKKTLGPRQPAFVSKASKYWSNKL